MDEKFVKKYWEEGTTLFYLHFQEGQAVRQIELTDNAKKLLSADSPTKDGSMLYDQNIEELELSEGDFTTREEFEQVWESNNCYGHIH